MGNPFSFIKCIFGGNTKKQAIDSSQSAQATSQDSPVYSTDYICDVMKNLINQLKERNIPITECRMSDYHFHEYYIRVNANPETIKTLHFEGAKIVKNSIVCDCHWSIMEFKEETSH